MKTYLVIPKRVMLKDGTELLRGLVELTDEQAEEAAGSVRLRADAVAAPVFTEPEDDETIRYDSNEE